MKLKRYEELTKEILARGDTTGTPDASRTAATDGGDAPSGENDDERREAIFAERDPVRLAELIFDYYQVKTRSVEPSRELMLLHLGMLTGAIMRLAETRT